MKNRRSVTIQAGAIPFRLGRGGRLEILLIRRVNKKKWGIPKGMVERGQSPLEAAEAESIEEAGATGELLPQSIGAFTYTKLGCQFLVHVYLLRVREAYDIYPEHRLRERAWFPVERAVSMIRHPEVRDMIRALPKNMASGLKGSQAFVGHQN